LQRSPASWREQTQRSAQGPDRSTLIAFADELPIGISALYRDGVGSESGELLQVWVDPAYRGKGVAGKILDLLLLWAQENDFRRVVAVVTFENARAQSFYRKVGFVPAHSPAHESADGIVLVHELTS